MTFFLTLLIGFLVAFALIAGIIFASIRSADRNRGAGMASWGENASGDFDPHRVENRDAFSDFGGGGDAGGGGGD